MDMWISAKEQERLVLENQKLVYHVVNKLKVKHNEYEDMISIGTVGLIKAAITFDESKKIKFPTYACNCIRNEVLMYLRANKSHAKNLSIDSPISIDNEGNELTFVDLLSGNNGEFLETILERESLERVMSIVLNLFEYRKIIIMLYFFAGNSQKIIGKKVNLTQGEVSRIIKRIRNKIKLYYDTEEQFEEFFLVSIVDDTIKISFPAEGFNLKFVALLQNLIPSNKSNDFKVGYSKGRIVVEVLEDTESFSYIAQIIQCIDEFNKK